MVLPGHADRNVGKSPHRRVFMPVDITHTVERALVERLLPGEPALLLLVEAGEIQKDAYVRRPRDPLVRSYRRPVQEQRRTLAPMSQDICQALQVERLWIRMVPSQPRVADGNEKVAAPLGPHAGCLLKWPEVALVDVLAPLPSGALLEAPPEVGAPCQPDVSTPQRQKQRAVLDVVEGPARLHPLLGLSPLVSRRRRRLR
mmetsp:Transcript_18312/g.64319  ORF Transcript_18312/g.64319 Transcript_18312/m.64319 type:complete len:201 (+) Transcript_18312:896-1498(+)